MCVLSYTEKEAEEEVGKPEVVPLTRDDTWRQAAPLTREWDKGKRTGSSGVITILNPHPIVFLTVLPCLFLYELHMQYG